MYNINDFESLITQKYISKQKHPEAPYHIYNYTHNAQFEKIWDKYPIVKDLRGLILDETGNVIARPFPKFFNLEEHNGVLPPYETFEVYDKLDGSLGISYSYDGKAYLATRGSFQSEQSKVGTSILNEKYKSLSEQIASVYNYWTYLFEIIYPENRIVIDYKGMKDIVLLGVINSQNKEELPYEKLKLISDYHGVPLVQQYNNSSMNTVGLYKLKEFSFQNKEGFVVKFDNGMRVKIKFEDYVKLHRIVSNTTAKSIFEAVSSGLTVKSLLQDMPDELFKWAIEYENKLREKYICVEKTCLQAIEKLKISHIGAEMKDVAAEIKKCNEYSGVLFNMWRGKNYKDCIWKIVKSLEEGTWKKENYNVEQN